MKTKPGAGISLLLSKSTIGVARPKVPTRRKNRHQQCTYLHIKVYIGAVTSDCGPAAPPRHIPVPDGD